MNWNKPIDGWKHFVGVYLLIFLAPATAAAATFAVVAATAPFIHGWCWHSDVALAFYLDFQDENKQN